MYCTYVLRSISHGLLYKGFTQDLDERVDWHNARKSKYTSKFLPWELVLFEEHSSKSIALKREKWYKTGVGRDWIKKEIESKD